jgi:DNA-binding transcriptional ArsR family regulator
MLSCSKIELSKALDMPSPTVSYYLKKLVDMEVIEEIPVVDGRIYPLPKGTCYIERKPIKSEKFYRRKNVDVVRSFYKLLIAHKANLDNKALIDTFLDSYRIIRIEYNSKPVKNLKKLDDLVDNALNVVNDIFHPPFCS